MGKPTPKYHQAVQGTYGTRTFTTALCDVGGGSGRLVDSLWDVPREHRCLSCYNRVPGFASTEPVVIVAADHFTNNGEG